MSKHFFILQGGQPLDGEFYDIEAELHNALYWAEEDAEIFQFDAATQTAINVTEQQATKAYWGSVAYDIREMIHTGRAGFWSRFIPEVSALQGDMQAIGAA
jgi:hypothetical protein